MGSEPAHLNAELNNVDAPSQRLACHLMLLFSNGTIALNQTVLGLFFTKAPDSLKAEAMAFIGRSMKGEMGDPPEAIVSRFTQLWDKRQLEIAQAGDMKKSHEELAAFGWWFASGKFDDKWAMSRLLDVLRKVKQAVPEHFVMERLVTIAPTMPEDAVECLRLFVEGCDDYWKVYRWRDEAQKILATAMQVGNANVRTEATKLINRLGQMGHFEFRDLLHTAQMTG